MVESDEVPIVEKGVDSDEENEAGQTALHVAIVNDDLEMVKFLLDREADVNRRTRVSENDEPPEASCECANTRYCVHVADEFGNEMRDDGQNALHLAAKYASRDALKLLIQRVENVNETSFDGSTAVHYATRNSLDAVSAVELLLDSGGDVNAQNRDGKTPLYLAVKFEKLELVEYLLSRGADVDISTAKRSTPLYSAIANANAELLKLLLANKASTDVENQRGQSPLLYALRVLDARSEARVGLAKLLLEHGAAADSRDGYGSTALHVAVQDRDVALGQLLISRGCPVDAKDRFDMSALALAVCTNRHDLATMLLERGADANASIAARTSVLEHAIIRRDEPMVELLLRHKAEPAGTATGRVLAAACSAACAHKSARIMQMLIDHGADVNGKDAQGRTPLMRAIRESNDTLMRHLVERGARVNERDSRGKTALHLLFDDRYRKMPTIEYLLEQGADVNARNHQGHTPFEYMTMGVFRDKEAMLFVNRIALLLDQRAHVDPRIIRQIHDWSNAKRAWADYLAACQAELGRMREARLLDKCTYHDLLTRRHSALGALFREQNAALAFEQGLRENALFEYCDLLRRSYARKCKRSKLIANAVDVIVNEVFRDRAVLPVEVVEHLCDYLSNDDLEKLL